MKVKTYNKGFEAHKTERQWAMIIHFSLQKLVFKKRQSK